MSQINKTLNKNVALGLSIQDMGILGGSTLLANKVTNKAIIPRVQDAGYNVNPWLLASVKVAAGAYTAFNVKNKYVRYAAVGVVFSGVNDAVNRAGSVVENKFMQTTNKSSSSNNGGLNPVF